jgi:dTDP-4-amino-4,6-dideoxygalactose transaminase
MTKAWRIPLCDPTRWTRDAEPELEDAFRRVLRSGRFILGEEVEAFERECARYLGVKHAIGVSSGTDALVVALSSLGIGPGDDVICPTFTFVATAEAIVRVGGTPVFADCGAGSFHVDARSVERAITKRTRAIVPVHLFGVAAPIESILEIAKRHDLEVVEDCAQSFGVRVEGRSLGTFGRLGCMSFFPSKLLGGFGDGGLVVTDDDALAAAARSLRQHGLDGRFGRAVRIGGNFRLDALQAAMLRRELGRLDAKLEELASVGRRYDEAIGGVAERPSPLGAVRSPYVVRLPDSLRDAAREELARRGIESAIHYRAPLHRHEAFGAKDGGYPLADRAAAECLSLPCFARMTSDEVAEVASVVCDFVRT